ncbi:MAG: hypothetical protein Q8M31_05710, partial [Beijerinckiaceae bacterium]|nr:hypothetical protein [Beijerinckiaceae bacterium]
MNDDGDPRRVRIISNANYAPYEGRRRRVANVSLVHDMREGEIRPHTYRSRSKKNGKRNTRGISCSLYKCYVCPTRYLTFDRGSDWCNSSENKYVISGSEIMLQPVLLASLMSSLAITLAFGQSANAPSNDPQAAAVSSRAAAAYDASKEDAKDMRLVGSHDLAARTAYQPTIKQQGDRWILYVGHHGGRDINPLNGAEEENGTSILDVT